MAGGARAEAQGYPDEFGLALECCAAAFRGATTRKIADLDGIDWERFRSIAEFHRIEGLVWNHLASFSAQVPSAISSRFSAAASEIGANNLHAAAECRDLLAAFEAAGVRLLFLKGLTLGALAYGNAAIKSAIDIDLLIDPGDLGKASVLLRERGYRVIIPNADAALDRWHERSKESVWIRKNPAVQIDVHTRTADTPCLISGVDVHAPQRLVDVGSGIRLPTFADEELFAYLAVHGAWSAWFRLKWIADFAGFLSGRDPDEIRYLYDRSQRLGAGRAGGQALLLADRLFGTLASATELRSELARDRSMRILCDGALRILTCEDGEPTERRFGTLQIHLLEFLLVPGLSYKVSEFARQLAKSALGPR